jgi:CHAD domain-containing protein
MALDREQLDKPIRKVRKLLKKMPGEPTPKQVHDLRTNSRRLEAMLQPAGPDQNGRKILKEISKLRKLAGKARDMDVLTGHAAELTDTGDEADCAVRLLEHLGAVRSKKAKKLSKAAQESAPELRKRLKRSSNRLQERASRPNSEENPSSHITSAALRMLSALSEPQRLDQTNLHPYRLKVKELQNLLRLAENGRDQEFVESLGEVKDAIGEWHDWVELEGIAESVLEHPQCRLLQELKMRVKERFAHAIEITEKMRTEYVGASGRRGGKRKGPHPAESVWSATSALVG